MEKPVTIKDILQNTVNSLNGIMLPVALMESVGREIAINVHNLNACINAIEQDERRIAAEAAQKKAEAPAEEQEEDAPFEPGEDEEQAVPAPFVPGEDEE